MIKSCSCNICSKQCRYRPGWFTPNQVNKLVEHLQLHIDEVFNNFLAIDWYEYDSGEVSFILAPSLKYHMPGIEYPILPSGECIFYVDNKCSIYELRPAECRIFNHEITTMEHILKFKKSRKRIADLWRSKREYIEILLGRSPIAKKLSLVDIVNHYS